MMHTFSLVTLTAIAPLMLLGMIWPFPGRDVVFAVCSVIFPVALMALGACRRGRLGPNIWGIGAVFVLLLLAMAGLFVFRFSGSGGPWWGGLPAAAAVQLYGLFVAPLLVTGLAYAWTFDRWGVRTEDLDDLRRRFGSSAGDSEP